VKRKYHYHPVLLQIFMHPVSQLREMLSENIIIPSLGIKLLASTTVCIWYCWHFGNQTFLFSHTNRTGKI